MLDAVFALEGGSVPEDYAYLLWQQAARILPWLEQEVHSGFLPLRGAVNGADLLLPRRARLTLRVPAARAAQAAALSGHALQLGSQVLRIGAMVQRDLQAHPTLHAQLVESPDEEAQFLEQVAQRLKEMGVVCRCICGRRGTRAGGGLSLRGYSLLLHDLKPAESLRIQRAGLGGYRRYGCGIFVPYKEISGLDG